MKLDEINSLSTAELLKIRLCDIDFNLKSSHLMRGINDLRSELNMKQINFMPYIWVSDDWFSPDGAPGFALPFYLLSKRLIKLEKEFTNRVEGSHHKEFMKLVRHETAHAMDNAYKLRRIRGRQKLFGKVSTPYPKSYLPDPQSKDYVSNLGDFYAQSHPEEDWAETFACWLNPHTNWKKSYTRGLVREKLNYVENSMINIKQKKPNKFKTLPIDCISRDTRTLEQYYKQKVKRLRLDRKPFSSKSLSILFNKNPILVKTVIKQTSKNSFISNKLINTIQRESEKNKFSLSTKNIFLADHATIEKKIANVTLRYIKENRHKVIM